jgi:signal transduction histidine kinase
VAASVRRALAANPVAVDAVIAGGLTVLSLLAVVGGANDAGARHPLSVALLLLQTIPLVLRRVAPLPVFLVSFGATVAHVILALDQGSLNESLGSLVALYTVAEQSGRRTSVPAAVAMGGTFAALLIASGTLPGSLSGLIQTELTVALAWAFGDVSRVRSVVGRLRAERDALRESEREERAAQAVTDERRRIARELHDVVTHHVTVVVIQAAAAQRALERRPAQAGEALVAIEHAGRLALTDMRRMLGTLADRPATGAASGSSRQASSDGGGPALAPMPGLAGLDDLLDGVRAAGLPVELSVAGERRSLDPGVELAAYRIVQEALTNALKHAGGGRATVALRYERDALELEVVDTRGAGAAEPAAPAPTEAAHTPHGVIGMRERAAVFGGRLEAGATPTGYRVVARLPLAGSTAAAVG